MIGRSPSSSAETSLGLLRAHFSASDPPHAELTRALPSGLFDEARTASNIAKYVAFSSPLLGRYEVADAHGDGPLLQRLAILASAVAATPLTPITAEWRRLRHRCYARSSDDRNARDPRITHELILDASVDLAGASEEDGPIVYTHRGEPFFVVPRRPGALTLVARRPGIVRHTRYVTHRMGNATFVRLVVGFGLETGVGSI
jgi:hypothetical protein